MEGETYFCNAGLHVCDHCKDEMDPVERLFIDCVAATEEAVLECLMDEDDNEAPPEIAANVIRMCQYCTRNASLVWWKCCPVHATETGPDVICQSCVEKLHPGEPEFAR